MPGQADAVAARSLLPGDRIRLTRHGIRYIRLTSSRASEHAVSESIKSSLARLGGNRSGNEPPIGKVFEATPLEAAVAALGKALAALGSDHAVACRAQASLLGLRDRSHRGEGSWLPGRPRLPERRSGAGWLQEGAEDGTVW